MVTVVTVRAKHGPRQPRPLLKLVLANRRAGNVSLRCPQCGTVVPAAKVFWFIRMFSFNCMSCNAKLALTGGARTILVASVAASVVISFAVKTSIESATPAIIVFFAGLLISCVLTWRMGELGIVEEAATDETQ